MSPIRLTLQQARHAWLARQCILEDSRSRTASEMISHVGWIPMPSAASPYLALFARRGIQTCLELDDPTLRRGEFSIVPGPRGTTCFVPTPEAPLARAFAVADHASREARVATGTTLTSKELQTTHDALRAALARPSTMDELRVQLPQPSLRTLGDAGRKSGLPTLAALVLRNMWVTGEIMRTHTDGRLDQRDVRWSIDPRPRTVPTAADAVVAIAARWLASHAPVSARAFASAFGIAAGRANGALKSANPVEVTIEGMEGAFLAPADFEAPAVSEIPNVRLLPLRDPLVDVQIDAFASTTLLRALPSRGGTPGPLAMVDGAVVGAWSYDEQTHTVGWRVVGADIPSSIVMELLDQEAVRTAKFIESELGRAPLHGPPPLRAPRHSSHPGDLAIEL